MNLHQVWPGAVPLDTDLLQPQRNAEIAIGFALQAAFGTSTLADGLACSPTTPASMSVLVGPGSLIYATTVDTLGTGFGSLAVDNSTSLVKMGINLTTATIGPLSAPGTSGQSQNYLIEAAFSEADGSPVTLPYYNAANPAVPYSGPANSGATSNTARTQTVTLQVKAGSPATTGSQTTPAPDAGFVGLWVVTVANGASIIVAGNISTFSAAPFIPAKLGLGMMPGFSHMQSFSSSGSFIVPLGVTRLGYQIWGGGGGGVNGGSGNVGGAGLVIVRW